MVVAWMAWALLFGLLAYLAALALEYGLQLAHVQRRPCWALAMAVVVSVPVLAGNAGAYFTVVLGP